MNLAASLHELSDAIEQLALIVSQQNAADNDVHVKQLALIVKKFKDSTQLSGETLGETSSSKPSSKAAYIRATHKKGYLKNWLESQNLLVADSIDTLRADEYLFAAVDYLADHYQHLSDFYKKLKHSQSIRKNFTHRTAKKSISYIVKWCEILKKHQLIDKFSQHGDAEIFVDIAEIHEATSFIYGYWLEVLLRKEIALILNKNLHHIQSFDVMSQVSILKPDQQNTELDLMLMVNNQVYWFECKSGVISKYFEKFNEHRKLLQLTEKNAFLIIPQKDANIALHTRKRAGMTALYGTELESILPKILFPSNP